MTSFNKCKLYAGEEGSRSGGVKQGWGGENKLFSSFMGRHLENGTRYDHMLVTILMTNRKLHMLFQLLAPRFMTSPWMNLN